MSWRTQDGRHLPRRGRLPTVHGMPAITVKGLHKAYEEHEAVRGVSFEVGRGEVFCLPGPHGARKTPTVGILEGHPPADAGPVGVLGFDPAQGGRALLG